MKKITQVVLAGLMAVGTVACSGEGTYTPGTYTGEAQGFGGKVSVTITVDKNKITDVKVAGDDETPTVGGAALEKLAAAIKEKQGAEFPFTRFFYEYKAPEAADDLLAQFMELEKSLTTKIAQL